MYPDSKETYGKVHLNPYPSAHERIDQLESLYTMLACDFSTYATMSKATIERLKDQCDALAEQIKKLLTQAEQQRLNSIRAPRYPMHTHSDGSVHQYSEDC